MCGAVLGVQFQPMLAFWHSALLWTPRKHTVAVVFLNGLIFLEPTKAWGEPASWCYQSRPVLLFWAVCKAAWRAVTAVRYSAICWHKMPASTPPNMHVSWRVGPTVCHVWYLGCQRHVP
jgi:hypothetical protein